QALHGPSPCGEGPRGTRSDAELPVMSTPRVLIVEPDNGLAADLVVLLGRFGFRVVARATDDPRALEVARQGDVDVAIVDIVLEGGASGITTAKALRDECGVPVVFLGCFADRDVFGSGLLAAPLWYLVKPIDPARLRTALELAYAQRKADRSQAAPVVPVVAREGSALTVREREVLLALSRGASTKAIAAALGIRPLTARNHLHNIMTKLGVHSRVAAVALAHSSGLVPPPEASPPGLGRSHQTSRSTGEMD